MSVCVNTEANVPEQKIQRNAVGSGLLTECISGFFYPVKASISKYSRSHGPKKYELSIYSFRSF